MRKPLSEETVVANVLGHGCGAINIDRSRVSTTATDLAEMQGRSGASTKNKVCGGSIGLPHMWDPKAEGRWPANLILTGSAEVVAEFPMGSPNRGVRSGGGNRLGINTYAQDAYSQNMQRTEWRGTVETGLCSASRFFYCVGALETDLSGRKP